jgi:alpha-L-fucosidase
VEICDEINRRETVTLMQQMRAGCFVLPALLCSFPTTAADEAAAKLEAKDRSARAREVSELRFGMFVCWSFSTFSGEEWTRGVTDVGFFKATGCDTGQWCRTAKKAGMKYILFLTKHHDGFCLWDTKTTDRKVTRSPLRIDALAKLRKSCDQHGLKLALYFSEGDWTWPDNKNPDLKKAQLKELCTEYGPIEFFWMDHAQSDGGLDHKATAEWVHEFQPDCFVGFNHGQPAGELALREMGQPGPVGNAAASKYNKEGEAVYKGYLAAEFTYPILPEHEGGAQWFYSLPKHDALCLPPEKIFKDYVTAAQFGNLFSLDVGPDYAGRLRDIDVKTLRQVGEMIRDWEAKRPR